MPSRLPVVLTIAGSDPGGGAGIQADLKTFHAFGAFGTSAITAVTVQNTRGVTEVHPIPLETVRAQIRAVAEDLPPAACKTGMLATAGLVHAVAESIRGHALPRYVLDPVMVATSGDRLLDRDAETTIVDELLPLAALVTPNLDEAAILAGFPVEDREGMRRAAAALVERGARAALLKGGHLRSQELVDILYDSAEWHEWRRPKLDTRNTHGTGCTLSAAVAAGLAHGRPLREAVEDALDYVQRAIREAPGLGGGHGPLNHLVSARVRERESA
ncbi:MAG TPA: bifunctional hydroxymethylpyrimidine kinase/phosphomethylpyrimidine kinase [Longimicrobiaceae bacterium]|nr:bifunctional hydroxymethylpyrimidine kinase/phosphomethylpyrimidine kinase [Longimicrobiaceae bacterium]